jgi:hypothetical protein
VTWTDKTGNLPDVPANSVAVDPDTPATLYVGTDVGVFFSTDDGTTWAELGTGLPNAPAVKVKIFTSGGVRKLRAATYGRGLWQLDIPKAEINFFSGPLKFVAVVGRNSAAQVATLLNSSGSAATVSNISLSGDYALVNGCPSVLSDGSSCPITVTFTPRSAGTVTTNLMFSTNAAGGTRSLQVMGTGIDFAINALGPRPARPSRSNAAGSVHIHRGETALVGLTLSASDAGALALLPPEDRQVKVSCVAPSGVQCSLDSSLLDLAQPDSEVRLALSVSVPAKARRLRGASAVRYNVTVTAAAGANRRELILPVTVD